MNLIIRNKAGRVVDYIANGCGDIEKYRGLESEGFTVECTEDKYIKKWNRWWLSA